MNNTPKYTIIHQNTVTVAQYPRVLPQTISTTFKPTLIIVKNLGE